MKHQPGKKQREVTLTDLELSRINHLRIRADVPPLTKEQAERFLSFCSTEVYREVMNRIR